ncbi:MAG: bifunctional precorrin-2 dehydrogenase/sirohydrochlorin ferrochelatase [Candidatus Zixiibacteriota bacterium]
MTSKYLPINVSLEDCRVLVVGGGGIALRKIDNLLDYNSDITVVAPEVTDKIDYYATSGRVKLEKRNYSPSEAADYGLVISACDDRAVNEQVFEDCKFAGVLVNVVDNPALCTFIFPAVVKREHLAVSVSTDGKAPFLAGHLRGILDDIFPKHWGKISTYAHTFRKKVQARYKDDAQKRLECFERFLSADWNAIIKMKSPDEIESELNNMLNDDE